MTMDDGLLSQEEIDALTAGLSKPRSAPASAALGLDPEIARPFMNLICDQGGNVVTTVVGKSVDMRLEKLAAVSPSIVPGPFAGAGLQCSITFSKDMRGSLYLLLNKDAAALLSDLMMMGDGSAPYEDEHRDAISELVNQVMGSATTALGSDLSLSVSIGQTKTQEFDPASIPMDAPWIATQTTLRVEGFPEYPILWVLDEDLVDSLRTNSQTVASGTDFGLTSSKEPESGLGGYENFGGSQSAKPSIPMGAAEGAISGVFGSTGNKALDLLMDIELPITIELGRTQMSLKRILEMGPGAIVEMDRFAGEPVDILINGKIVARGEVVVVDENFGVRIVSLVTPEERLKLLR